MPRTQGQGVIHTKRIHKMVYHESELLTIDYRPKITEEIESNLVFVGLIGMIDPPREGVKEAVTTCRNAGIKTVMITGDHIDTACAIAKDLEILKLKDLAITGEELNKIPQKELEKDIMNYAVFARVSPEHKVRIVKAFQNTGNIVAMTGDRRKRCTSIKKCRYRCCNGKSAEQM